MKNSGSPLFVELAQPSTNAYKQAASPHNIQKAGTQPAGFSIQTFFNL